MSAVTIVKCILCNGLPPLIGPCSQNTIQRYSDIGKHAGFFWYSGVGDDADHVSTHVWQGVLEELHLRGVLPLFIREILKDPFKECFLVEDVMWSPLNQPHRQTPFVCRQRNGATTLGTGRHAATSQKRGEHTSPTQINLKTCIWEKSGLPLDAFLWLPDDST